MNVILAIFSSFHYGLAFQWLICHLKLKQGELVICIGLDQYCVFDYITSMTHMSDPYMTFDPTLCWVTYMHLRNYHCIQVPWKSIKIKVCWCSNQFDYKRLMAAHDPYMTFDATYVGVTYMPQLEYHCTQVLWKSIKVCWCSNQCISWLLKSNDLKWHLYDLWA